MYEWRVKVKWGTQRKGEKGKGKKGRGMRARGQSARDMYQKLIMRRVCDRSDRSRAGGRRGEGDEAGDDVCWSDDVLEGRRMAGCGGGKVLGRIGDVQWEEEG